MVKLNVRPPINEVPVEVSAEDLDPIIGLDDLDAGRVSGPVGFNSQRITDVATPLVPTDAATKQYVDSRFDQVPPRINAADSARIDLTFSGDTLTADLILGSVDGSRIAVGTLDDTHMSPVVGLDDLDGSRIVGPVDFNAQRIVNVAAPVQDQDAATKRYADRVGRLTYDTGTQQIVFTRGDGTTDTANLGLSSVFDSVTFDSVTNELVFDPAGASPEFRVPLAIDTTRVAVADTSSIDLSLSGDGSTASPYTVSGTVRPLSVTNGMLANAAVTAPKLAAGLLDFGKVIAGSNVTVTGTGTAADPYVVTGQAGGTTGGVTSVTDTTSIDLTLTGTALSAVIASAGVKAGHIDPAVVAVGANLLRMNSNGTLAVLPTVADSTTIDMSVSGADISAAVRVSTEQGNALAATTTGLYSPLPAMTAADSPTIDFTLSGAGTFQSPWALTGVVRPGSINGSHVPDAALSGAHLADGSVTGQQVANGTLSVAKLASTVGVDDLGGTRVTGPVDVNTQRIVNVGTPTGSSDAATKAYVDLAVSGASSGNVVTSVADTTSIDLTLTTGQLTASLVNASLTRAHLSAALAADMDDAVSIGGFTLAQLRDAGQLTGTLAAARIADGSLGSAKLAAGLLDFGKVVAGSNVTVTGAGTTASPYVVNALASGGTTISVTDSSTIDLTLTGSDLTATVKAASIVAGMLAPGVLDFGKVAAGTNSTVSGTGTAADPYRVNVALPSSGVQTVTDTATIDLTLTGTALSASLLAGSVTGAHLAAATVTADKLAPNAVRVTAGTNVTVTGAGTTASPYVVNATGGTAAGSLNDLDGSLLTGPVHLNSQRIIALADPVLGTDAATKQYVDTAVAAGSDKVVAIAHATNGVVTLNWALGNVFVLSGVTGNITGFSSINEPPVRHGSIILVAAATIQVTWTGLNTPGELTATTTLAAGDAATIGIVAGTALPTI